MKVKSIFWVLLILVSGKIQGQWTRDFPDGDTAKYSLLINPFIRIESTEAIDAMYNFEFEKAHSHFHYLQLQYPWHPLPYLLKGLNYWWQIVPDYNNTSCDEAFLAYMDTTRLLAKNIRDKYNEIEGAFFLAAAYAFEGRLHSERRNYRKAALASGKSLKYLKDCRGHETYSPELLFGDALFNYYAEWIRDEYPLLRPLMAFFPKGDKKLGIRQLLEVTRNAFYSRTEARFYLMRILSSGEDKNLREALRVGKILHQNYPDNPYFHRYYARLLYQSGKYTDARNKSLEILQRINSGMTGYEANSGRYACFFLGHYSEVSRNYEEAKKYYKMGLKYAEEAKATKKGYYFYSLLHLGKIAKKEGHKEVAREYFKRVKKAARRSHLTHKQAREELKKI
ncbi:MAG: tol-pal system protein YbgF [Ekhidna sp.]|nr:tol-pal system protein YbgF [Ekhidna sp.]MBC6410940.1 tol-pal system protein YbgF [Ekhidna sp.]